MFHVEKSIIGMLHLGNYGREAIFENAKREIEQMYSNGMDAILAENYFGDVYDVE